MRALFRRPPLYVPSFYQHTRTIIARPRPVRKHTTPWNPTTNEQILKDAAPQKDGFSYDEFKARKEKEREAGLNHFDPGGRRHALQRMDEYFEMALAAQKAEDAPEAALTRKKLRARLWQTLSLAKKYDPTILQRLRLRDWDLLWASSSIRSKRDRYARAHAEDLYHTQEAAGKKLQLRHHAIYIESMFLNGNEQEAIEKWKEVCGFNVTEETGGRKSLLKSCVRDAPRLIAVGIRMYANTGNLALALELMDILLEAHPTFDRSIMMNVLRAHARSELKADHEKAWSIYERMTKTTLADYDASLIGFLEARKLQYAERVFGDMVKAGHLAAGNSEKDFDDVFSRLHRLYKLGTDIAGATGIALHAITVLPKEYHVRIFEDWMKHTVYLHAAEAALQILDMMFSRGLEPTTTHFNLLLQALLRTKDKPNELKAENIAWHMVQASSNSTPVKRSSSSAALDPLLRKVPTANATTYASLIDHHASLEQWEHVDYLVRRMRENEVRPNELVMNVLIDMECRKGNYNKVWEIYTSLTRFPEDRPLVFPNGASIRCLWKTMRLALGDNSARETLTLPTPRQLLAETISWFDLVRSRHDADSFRLGLAAPDQGALETLVLHSFSYTKDLPGTLVALHALRDRFDYFPSSKALKIIINHISWVDMAPNAHQHERSQLGPRANFQKKVDQMGHIYQIILDARVERHNIRGNPHDYMSNEQIGEFNLNSLSEFIRVVLKRQYLPQEVEDMIDEAKMEVGLPYLQTGDMDAFGAA